MHSCRGLGTSADGYRKDTGFSSNYMHKYDGIRCMFGVSDVHTTYTRVVSRGWHSPIPARNVQLFTARVQD